MIACADSWGMLALPQVAGLTQAQEQLQAALAEGQRAVEDALVEAQQQQVGTELASQQGWFGAQGRWGTCLLTTG